MFIESDGGKYQYLSPQFVEFLKQEFAKQELAPENWKTPKILADELYEDIPGIRKVAQALFLRSGPNSIKSYYRKDQFNQQEHYSPELVALIQKEFIKIRGETIPRIVIRLKKPEKLVAKVFQQTQEEHPDWFVADEKGQIFCSPPAFSLIHKKLMEYGPEEVKKYE